MSNGSNNNRHKINPFRSDACLAQVETKDVGLITEALWIKGKGLISDRKMLEIVEFLVLPRSKLAPVETVNSMPFTSWSPWFQLWDESCFYNVLFIQLKSVRMKFGLFLYTTPWWEMGNRTQFCLDVNFNMDVSEAETVPGQKWEDWLGWREWGHAPHTHQIQR